MVLDSEHRHRHRRQPASPVRRRGLPLVAAVLVLAVVGLTLAVSWWRDGGTVRTEGRPATAPVTQAQLLGVADLQAVWPGPWAVMRTARPSDFDRPLVGCAPAVSPLDGARSSWVRWAIHAPPQADGPALTELIARAADDPAAAAGVQRVRAWMTSCPPASATEGGSRTASLLRELPAASGFLAQVHRVTPDYETYEQVAVGRVGDIVVLVSYGEYPGPLGHPAPDPSRILAAFHRAITKLDEPR